MNNDLLGFDTVVRKVATYADVVYKYVKGFSIQAIADEYEIAVEKVKAVIQRAEEAGHLALSLEELVQRGANPEGDRTASLQLDQPVNQTPAQPTAPTAPVESTTPTEPTAPALPPADPTQPSTPVTDPTQPQPPTDPVVTPPQV